MTKMDNIVNVIKTEIALDYYQQNFSNDGQRFVAWYMRNVHLLDQCQTKDAVTDGANDKQIDAVYIDEDEQKIYIIQGKYYLGDTIDAEPVREVISSWTQFNNLAVLQENANDKLKKKISEVSLAMEDDSYCLCFELITTSTFSAAAEKDVEAFQKLLTEDENDYINAQFSVIDRDGLVIGYLNKLIQF